jgi:hypothetical protein
LYSYGYPFINWLRPLRFAARRFALQYGRLKTVSHDKDSRTRESGSNLVNIPFARTISNRVILYPLIQFSKIFNSGDLGEGYLVLVKKKA